MLPGLGSDRAERSILTPSQGFRELKGKRKAHFS